MSDKYFIIFLKGFSRMNFIVTGQAVQSLAFIYKTKLDSSIPVNFTKTHLTETFSINLLKRIENYGGVGRPNGAIYGE